MKKITFLTMLLIITNLVIAQWQPTNGPYGGIAYRFATDGNDIYVGTMFHSGFSSAGIFKSSDLGNTWIPVNNGLPAYATVPALIIKDSIILASISNSGIYSSSDHGNSWTLVSTLPATSMAICNSKLFAAIGGGIFISSDNGLTWSQVSSVYTNIVSNGTILYTYDYYGVYSSTNNGVSWTQILTTTWPVSIATNGQNIFVGTEYNGIFFSNDNGNIWTPVNNGLPSYSEITAIYINDTNIYASVFNNGIYLSSNNGNNWTAINNGLTDRFVFSIIKCNNYLFSANRTGVYSSPNNGLNWTWKGGFTDVGVTSLTVFDSLIFATTEANGVFVTNNEGGAWSLLSPLTTTNYFWSSAIDTSNILYIGSDVDGVFVSSNYGNSWNNISNGLPANYDISYIAIKDTFIFAGTGSGMYLSNDNGNNWIASNNGIPANTWIKSISIDNNNIIAGGWHGVYLSNNNGASWSALTNGLPSNPEVGSVLISDSTIYAGIRSHGIYKTEDLGNTWYLANNGLSNCCANSIIKFGTTLLVGTDNGVFYSDDNGGLWNDFNNGLQTNYFVKTLTYDNNNLYAGTYGKGVWKRTLSELVSTQENKSGPEIVIYPNPSNGIVYIKNYEKNIFVEIFNCLGKKIYSCANKIDKIDLTQNPKGMYFFKVYDSKETYIQKVIIQ